MPVNALRSVEDHFDTILRHVRPKRLVAEMKVADKGFHFRYFRGYRPEKIGRGRVRKIANKELFGAGDGHELFANLIIVHWNEGEARLYREMVAHVQTINEDVEAIEHIDDADAHRIIDDLLQRHERDAIYCCVRLNGVRFGEPLIASRLIAGEDAPDPAASEAAPEPEGEEAEATGTAEAAAPAEPPSEPSVDAEDAAG